LLFEQFEKYITYYKYGEAEVLCDQMAKELTQEPFARFVTDKKEEIGLLKDLQERIIKARNQLPIIKKAPYKTTTEKLILPLGGGYIGIPWHKFNAQEIYEIANRSVSADDFIGRLGLVVYCMNYHLIEYAERDLRNLMTDFPQKVDYLHSYHLKIQGRKRH